MSVPEGKMRLELTREEVWLLHAAITGMMYGTGASQGLLSVCRPSVAKMQRYLEATDGSRPAWPLPPDTQA